ncbi:MAG: YlzJ-like family protein [Clostridiales bacterium]|nr:YlzJ-like family protein [Clostridiales bacterium]
MMWTILPPVEGPAEVKLEVLEVAGRKVLCAPGEEPGTFRIERLLSTDPMDFLDPRFQPGTWISIGPRA